jgi:hypothetical protein
MKYPNQMGVLTDYVIGEKLTCKKLYSADLYKEDKILLEYLKYEYLFEVKYRKLMRYLTKSNSLNLQKL